MLTDNQFYINAGYARGQKKQLAAAAKRGVAWSHPACRSIPFHSIPFLAFHPPFTSRCELRLDLDRCLLDAPGTMSIALAVARRRALCYTL